MRPFKLASFTGILLGVAAPVLAQGQDWADLKIRFVLEGKAAKPQSLAMVNAQCLAAAPVDESLLVNRKNNGISNVVVFLWTPLNGKLPPTHPSFDETKNDSVTIDNKDCRFIPRVAIKRATQDLVLTNSDPFGHNMKADFFNNVGFNLAIPGGSGQVTIAAAKQLNKAETLPVPIGCNIHPHMAGTLFIPENPYAVVSDGDGNALLKNLPVGSWTLAVWHERSGLLSQVKTGGKAVTWPRGRFKVTVPKAGLNMGTVTVPQGTMRL